MDDTQAYKIYFEDVDEADANIYASELREAILDSSPDVISAEIEKEDPTTQDFGATLVLVLGTPVAIALAKGVADYLRSRGQMIKITTEEGEVIATGIDGEDAAKIAKAFAPKE